MKALCHFCFFAIIAEWVLLLPFAFSFTSTGEKGKGIGSFSDYSSLSLAQTDISRQRNNKQ